MPNIMRMEVSVVLVEQNKRFLVLKRPAGAHLAGLWEFPGGKKKPEESWDQCAHRELFEETGLTASELSEIRTIVHPYADRTVEIRFYYTGHARGNLTTDHEYAWLFPAEMHPEEFPEANSEIIKWLRRTTVARRNS